jgi:gluconolactonase
MPTQPLRRLDEVRVIASGLDHPECVTAGPDGLLYAGGARGQIYRIDPRSAEVLELTAIGSFVAGVVTDGLGNVYACDVRRGRVVQISSDGLPRTYADGGSGIKMRTPNYMVFDSLGRLLVSDSGVWGQNDGLIWSIARNGEARVFSERVRAYANGLALTPDGTCLSAVESGAGRVVQLPLDAESDVTPRVLVRLRRVVPDGLAYTRDGDLIIACYRPDRIYRLLADGRVSILLDDWQAQVLIAPTNVTFFGRRLGHLAMASLGGNEIRAISVEDHPGMPLNYPWSGVI